MECSPVYLYNQSMDSIVTTNSPRNFPTFFFLALLLLVTTPEYNAKETNIIYTTDRRQISKVEGKVGVIPGKGSLKAFVVPVDSQMGIMTKTLVSPRYQVPVKARRFRFPFIEEDQYILGVYRDNNKNGLLDLGSEVYRIASPCPIDTRKGEAYKVLIRGSDPVPLKLKFEGAPEEGRRYLHAHTRDGNPLFLLPANGDEVLIEHIPYPVKMSFVYDKDENNMIDSTEQSYNFYFLPEPQKEKVVIQWGKPWKPLTIKFTGNAQIERRFLIHQESGERSEISTSRQIDFLDKELGTYQVITQIKDAMVPSLKLIHQGDSTFELPFDEKYKVHWSSNMPCKRAQVFRNNVPYFEANATSPLFLYKPGNYALTCYEDLDGNGTLDINTLKNRNVRVATFVLDEEHSSSSLDFPNEEMGVAKGTFFTLGEPKSEGQIVFFQDTGVPGVFNMLDSFPLMKASNKGSFKFKFNVDLNSVLLATIDFDENFEIDSSERDFVLNLNPRELQSFESMLIFPQVPKGRLGIKMNSLTPSKYYIEILSPRDKEVVAAGFLKDQAVFFENLPLEVQLSMRLIYDENSNQQLDDSDHIYELTPISISRLEPVIVQTLQTPNPKSRVQ